MLLDKLITTFDTGLRTVFAQAVAGRERPDASVEETPLSESQKKQAASLMRINHVGEVCAQALYSGQAFTSRNAQTVKSLQHAANEETGVIQTWLTASLVGNHTSNLTCECCS